MSRLNRSAVRLVSLSPLALAVALGSASAAVRSDLHEQSVALINSQYKLAVAATGRPAQANVRHAELIDLDPESSLDLLSSVRDANGTVNYRYQQSFRGIPVFGEQVVVSEERRR